MNIHENPLENSEQKSETNFGIKLLDAWTKLHPEAVKVTVSKQDQMQEYVSKIEQKINDQKIKKVLQEYQLTPEILSINSHGEITIAIKSHFAKKKLPKGYAYKGGAARALLLRALGMNKDAEPRDLDIVRINTQEPFPGSDAKLAQKFMPEDNRHGYGVEKINEFTEYFQSRDFTINELYADDEKIVVSKQGLLDTIRGIIRPTEYELQNYPKMSYKLMSKCIRFYSEQINKLGYGTIETDKKCEPNFLPPFYMALHLDRALSISRVVAESYIEELKEKNYLPSSILDPEEAIEYLSERMTNKDFYFRFGPSIQFLNEQRWQEEEEKLTT